MRRLLILLFTTSMIVAGSVQGAAASDWGWWDPPGVGGVTAVASGPGGGPPPPGGTGSVTDPDGDISRATALIPPSPWAKYDSLDAYSDDLRDVYAVDVSAGDHIIVRLSSGTALTDFDLVIFAPGSVSVADTPVTWSAQLGTSSESASFSPAQLGSMPGTYYVEVRSKGTSPAGSYTLTVIRNDNGDIPGASVVLPMASDGYVNVSDNPDDVHDVNVAWGEVVYVYLEHPSTMDFEVRLFAPGTTTLLGEDTYIGQSVHTTATKERLSFSPNSLGLPAGTYYVDVHAKRGAGAYTLNVFGDPDGDMPGLASISGVDWTTSGWTNELYDRTDTWETVPLAVGQVVLLGVTGGSDTLSIWGPSATSIYQPYVAGGGRQVSWWVKSPGKHYIAAVETMDGVDGEAYQLTARILPVDADFGMPGTLVSLPYSGTRRMSYASNVSDTYRFQANAGDCISVWTSSADAGADLDLWVGGPDTGGGWYSGWNSTSPVAAHLIEFTAPTTGEYYVQVSSDMFTVKRTFDYTAGIRMTSSATSPSIKSSTSLSIKSSATSVTRPKPFILSGIFNGGSAGDWVIVWVKKPGRSYFSYSSNRICFGTVPGGTNWWYRYTPLTKTCPAGTYYFKVSYPGSATRAACVSPVITMRIR